MGLSPPGRMRYSPRDGTLPWRQSPSLSNHSSSGPLNLTGYMIRWTTKAEARFCFALGRNGWGILTSGGISCHCVYLPPNVTEALAIDWFTQASFAGWIFGSTAVRTEYEYRILFGRQQLAVPIIEHQAVPKGPKGPFVFFDFSTFSPYDFFCILLAVRAEGVPKCDLKFRVVHASPLRLFLHAAYRKSSLAAKTIPSGVCGTS